MPCDPLMSSKWALTECVVCGCVGSNDQAWVNEELSEDPPACLGSDGRNGKRK